MADVLATMKIMPESPEVDLEALKETIQNGLPEDAEFQNITEEPIAFGLVALILNFTIEDGWPSMTQKYWSLSNYTQSPKPKMNLDWL